MTSRSRRSPKKAPPAPAGGLSPANLGPPLRLVWPPEGVPHPAQWPASVKQWLLACARRDGGSWERARAPYAHAPDADDRAAYHLLRSKTIDRVFHLADGHRRAVTTRRVVGYAEAYAIALDVAPRWARGEATLMGGLLPGSKEANVSASGTTSSATAGQPSRKNADTP